MATRKSVKKTQSKKATQKPTQKSSKKKVSKKKASSKSLRKTTVKKKTAQPNVSYLFTEKAVTVTFPWKDVFRTKAYAVGSKEYEAVLVAARKGDMKQVISAITQHETSVNNNLVKFNERNMKLVDGAVYIDDRPVPADLSERIIEYAQQKLPYASLVKFWRKLQNNPSFRATQGLFRFLDANHFPITEDGNFLAYKGVNESWKDCYTNTMNNSIGTTVQMPRNLVNEDPEQACSNGLHVASYKYAHSYYGAGRSTAHHTVVVSVDPQDVVAVPFADQDEKMRVCKYVVVAESLKELTEHVVDENNPYKCNDEDYCSKCENDDSGDCEDCEDCEVDVEFDYGDEY